MKLVLSIVSNKDAQSLTSTLIKKGYRATKLASTGGFLQAGNTTLLMGVEENQVEDVITIIGEVCRSRQEILTPISPMTGPAEPYYPYAVEVQVGGATIFVLDVEKHLKV